MQSPKVRKTTTADETTVINTIVLAFSADPVTRWCWPDSHQYLSSMPSFARAFGGGAFQHDTAHCTEDHGGAALWLPPEVHPDEAAMSEVMENSIPETVRSDLSSIFEQMASFHPNQPHWYLPLIGVDPLHQGKGLGGALMKYALERCDRDGSLAYLESSNPRNISLYERHGFKVLGTVQAGTSPPLVPMLRQPNQS